MWGDGVFQEKASDAHCADGPQCVRERETGHTGRSGHRGRRISPHPFFSDETRQTCCQPYSSIARALPALNPFLILSSMKIRQHPLLSVSQPSFIKRSLYPRTTSFH
ncbi:hypothetical protein CDAR_422411 [Caerostris darwini]|uniref:Uncharacterized protein n=1 Tax=Caerostris darwini TaxID=1538125 RepID=A0AAV4N590_9ARAC|nr:hypothetical protein CDAR_422411 [Caerostris darwini]